MNQCCSAMVAEWTGWTLAWELCVVRCPGVVPTGGVQPKIHPFANQRVEAGNSTKLQRKGVVQSLRENSIYSQCIGYGISTD